MILSVYTSVIILQLPFFYTALNASIQSLIGSYSLSSAKKLRLDTKRVVYESRFQSELNQQVQFTNHNFFSANKIQITLHLHYKMTRESTHNFTITLSAF